MSCDNLYQSMEKLEWNRIPGTNYILKYQFMDDGFSILLSNMKEVFGEKLTEAEIQRRFFNYNPHAEMKSKVILKNVKKSLENIFANERSDTKVDCFEGKLDIHLQFYVNQVSFVFSLEPILLLRNEFLSYVFVPVLSHALLTQYENMALKKKISDLENKFCSSISPQKSILDYKTNSKAFSLFENDNVSEAVVLDAFLEIQTGMKECFDERSKIFDHHKKLLLPSSSQQPSKTSNVPVKREIADVLEPTEIKYDDDAEERNSIKNENQATLPIVQNVKTKKKKCLKF